MKIAISHDWLVTYAGAERVLEQILQLYPSADLYSLIDFMPEGGREFILGKRARTSFIQRMPFAKSKYRNYLPLMPLAVERLDLSGYDLVISSSHAVAKGVRTGEGQLHVCYCHTPMRYVWGLRDQYLREMGFGMGLKGVFSRAILNYVRGWDYRNSSGVSHFIAVSKYIAERIRLAYGRDSVVIYPPVDTKRFTIGTTREDFYLAASRMVPYKRMGLIAEAFAKMPDRKLVVIGEGPEFDKVKSLASKNIEVLGYKPPEVLKDYMQRARAFVFAAEEDFGIVLLEAQACGTPVIAFGKGGATETVVEGRTGVFFREQTAESIKDAVERFEGISNGLDPHAIRKNAERFGKERFREEFRSYIEKVVSSREELLRQPK